MRRNKNYYYSRIISKNIRKFKYLLGLDTETFASRCGLTPERIRELEDGKNVITNGIDLLRIAEGCNVRYEEVFETEDEHVSWTGFNVGFPPTLFSRMEVWWNKKGKDRKFVSKAVGAGADMISRWVRDKGYPSPRVFSNLLALFNLRACDLEAMLKDDSLINVEKKHIGRPVKGAKEEQKPVGTLVWREDCQLPEPKLELVESEDSCKKELNDIAEKLEQKTKEQPQPDEFEIRMLKVMRLQKDIDSLMSQTKAIMTLAYDLYKQLENLK